MEEELWNAGVRVSQFLCKGETHLITDRQRNVQPERVAKALRKFSPYSRPACTDKKALSSTNNSQRDIFTKALALNVEIVPPQTVRSVLDATHRSTNVRKKVIKVQCRKLKPPFIKVEDQSRKYRPLVKEFSQWPAIESQTNKSFSNKNTVLLKEKANFCENCNVFIHHKDLNSHLKSDLHQNIYISHEGYYDAVDNAMQNIPTLEEFVEKVQSKHRDVKQMPVLTSQGMSFV